MSKTAVSFRHPAIAAHLCLLQAGSCLRATPRLRQHLTSRRVRRSSLIVPEGLDDHGERREVLPSAGIVEKVASKLGRPVFKDKLQSPVVNVLLYIALRNEGDAIIHSGGVDHLAIRVEC